MWETIKKYWQIIAGFLIAIISALVLTNSKNEKTKSKLNRKERKDNKNLKKIAERGLEKQRNIIEEHQENVEDAIEKRSQIEKDINRKVEKNKENLEAMSNEELAALLNKRD